MRCLVLSMLSVFVLFSLTSCASSTKVENRWTDCRPVDSFPVVNKFKAKGTTYQVAQCQYPPKTQVEYGVTVGENRKVNVWKTSDKNQCYFSIKPKSEDGGYGVYALDQQGNPQLKRNSFFCGYAGFLPLEDTYLKVTHSGRIEGGRHGVDYKMLGANFDKGIYSYSALIEYHPTKTSGDRVKILNSEGNIIHSWDNVMTRGSHYLSDDEKKYDSQYLFEVGDAVAVVTSNYKRTWKHPSGKSKTRLMFSKERNSISALPGEKRELHLIDNELNIIKSFSANEFIVQPMISAGLKPMWFVLAPLRTLDGHQLYGLMNEKGRAVAPRGTLGIKPVAITTRFDPSSPFNKTLKQHSLWLVAYQEDGKIIWGGADADFERITEPQWQRVATHEDGWVFVQRSDNKKWQFIDGLDSGLANKEFSSQKQALKEVEQVMKERELVQKNYVAQREAQRRAFNERSHQINLRKYAQAKAEGDREHMKRIAKRDRIIEKSYMLSGQASNGELEDFSKKHYVNQAEKRKIGYILEQRKREAERQRRIQAEIERRRKIQAQRERWARKRAELNAWRSKMMSNINKTNRAVKETWNKHQLDMYEKGYIEFPK